MKTKQLISTLTIEERQSFLKLLIAEKQVRSKCIFQALLDEENVSKEKLYFIAFRKKFEAEKDYLIRNELRILNEAIEDFIVNQEIKKDKNKFYKQRILLQKYLENDSKELFLQLYKEAFDNVKDHVFSKQLEDLLDLKSKWYAKNFSYWSEQNFEFYKEYMAYKDRIYNYCLQIYYKYNSKINIASYNIDLNQSKDKIKKQIGNKEFVENEILPNIPFKDLEPYTIAIYYDGKSCNMNFSTLQRIEHLKQAVVYLKESPEYVFGFYERLAQYYLRELKDLTTLYHYRKEAYLLFLNLIDKPQAIYHTGAISKYIIACIYTKKHEEAINTFEMHLAFLEKNCREITNLKLLIIVAYIMLDNIDKAYNLLPINYNNYPKIDMYFGRLLFSLVHIELKNFDLAKTEIDNAIRSLYATPFKEVPYDQAFKGLNMYLNKQLGKEINMDKMIKCFENELPYLVAIKDFLIYKMSK